MERDERDRFCEAADVYLACFAVGQKSPNEVIEQRSKALIDLLAELLQKYPHVRGFAHRGHIFTLVGNVSLCLAIDSILDLDSPRKHAGDQHRPRK